MNNNSLSCRVGYIVERRRQSIIQFPPMAAVVIRPGKGEQSSPLSVVYRRYCFLPCDEALTTWGRERGVDLVGSSTHHCDCLKERERKRVAQLEQKRKERRLARDL